VPLDAVDLCQPASAQPIRRLGARHVIGVTIEHCERSADPRLVVELERTRADGRGDRLGGIALQILRAHDNGDLPNARSECEQQVGIGLLQLQLEGLRIDRIDRRQHRQHLRPNKVAVHPSLQ
jgi:hypothetical protein